MLGKEKSLSQSSTLYKAIKKIIDKKNLTMEEFYNRTLLDRSILARIKKGKSRTQLRIIVTICIGLNLLPMQSYELIRLAGYHLCEEYDGDYMFLLHFHYMSDIYTCNEELRKRNVPEKDFLGTHERKKKE